MELNMQGAEFLCNRKQTQNWANSNYSEWYFANNWIFHADLCKDTQISVQNSCIWSLQCDKNQAQLLDNGKVIGPANKPVNMEGQIQNRSIWICLNKVQDKAEWTALSYPLGGKIASDLVRIIFFLI